MNGPQLPVTAVCCGIFRRELGRLGPSALGKARPVFFNSMLHMRPAVLDAKLARLTNDHPESRFLLVYGDCSPHMAEFSRRDHVRKVAGINCCEILLGPDAYRELRRDGVFFFLPEWTRRWGEVFKHQLGFSDPVLARDFMHEMHKRLLYLDTGLVEVPHRTLAAIARYFAMPVEVRGIGLECLAAALADGLGRLARDE